MMQINRTSRFKKDYRQMLKRGFDHTLFEYVVGEIANGRPLEPKYNDHALKGSFEGFRECHIQRTGY